MKGKKIIAMVEKCEAILEQVETHAAAIQKMHDHMCGLIEHNKKLQNDLQSIQQEEVQQQLIELASKAAKKAAKKSIAKARIRDALKDQETEQSDKS